MFGIGFAELIVIMVVALPVFGPSRLSDIGTALGKGIRDLQRASRALALRMHRR